jgi:hypothetical protein
MTRRGITLVELVVAAAASLVVLGAVHRLVVSSLRLSRTQAAQIELQSNLRTAVIVIASEIRQLNGVRGGSAEQIDILSFSSTALTYRAARGIGFLCAPAAAAQLRVARGTFSGIRDPQPLRDVAYLLVDASPEPDRQTWVQLPITDVAAAVVCESGEAAIGLTTSAAAALAAAPGTPVRFYETMELRVYQSDGRWWLGARSVDTGEAIQPVAGPLDGPDGLRFEYRNGNGAATTDPGEIKSIVLTVRGTTENSIAGADGEPLIEQLAAQVALRNTPAP